MRAGRNAGLTCDDHTMSAGRVNKAEDLVLSDSASILYPFPFLLAQSGVLPTVPSWGRCWRGTPTPGDGDIAQLARAMALQAIGRGFESHYLHEMPRVRERPGAGFFDITRDGEGKRESCGRVKHNMVKRERAYGGCLGAARRRRP